MLVSERIARVFVSHRRSADCAAPVCEACVAHVASRVRRFTDRDEPVQLILPAFPTKSPNPAKVLGRVPDMAEQLALGFLEQLCIRIADDLYPPGAKIIIASDGRVFSDLIRVDDDDVTRYQRGLRAMFDHIGARSLELFNLEDVIAAGSFAQMRRDLIARFGIPLETIQADVRGGGEPLALYRGICRFLFEDAQGLCQDQTNTQLQKESRRRAYEVVQRSKAWGALVDRTHPDAVRLSIHPQRCGAPKLGIHMVATNDNWLTPWHAVALKTPNGFYLVKRRDAEQLDATLVDRDGAPDYFEVMVPIEPAALFGPPPDRRRFPRRRDAASSHQAAGSDA